MGFSSDLRRVRRCLGERELGDLVAAMREREEGVGGGGFCVSFSYGMALGVGGG